MGSHLYDIIIKNGLVFDGTRAPRFRADIGIRDGVISALGYLEPGLGEQYWTRMVTMSPRVRGPARYDAQLFWDPYCTLSGWHGIASVAIGNCGFGFAPLLRKP